MPDYDIANVRHTMYTVTWNAVALGGLDGVKFNVNMNFKPVKIGTAGEMKLDDMFMGLGDQDSVSLLVRESTLARMRAMCPWDNGSGAVDLTPPVGTRLAQYAQQMVLHPIDKAEVTTEDIEIFKTVPVSSFLLPRDGKSYDVWECIFWIYPDLAKLQAGTPAYMQLKGA